jgi:hypothetical protein
MMFAPANPEHFMTDFKYVIYARLDSINLHPGIGHAIHAKHYTVQSVLEALM